MNESILREGITRGEAANHVRATKTVDTNLHDVKTQLETLSKQLGGFPVELEEARDSVDDAIASLGRFRNALEHEAAEVAGEKAPFLAEK